MSGDKPKVHPIQTGRFHRGQAYCPQVVTLRAYKVYCKLFGAQVALVSGDCRGGFGAGELVALLYARSFPEEEWSDRFRKALHGMEGL